MSLYNDALRRKTLKLDVDLTNTLLMVRVKLVMTFNCLVCLPEVYEVVTSHQ